MTNEEAIRILKIAIEDSKEHIRFCFDIKGIEALRDIERFSEMDWQEGYDKGYADGVKDGISAME